MKLTSENTEIIKNDFAKLKSKDDLLNILNKIRKFEYGENTFLINLKTLTYFSNPEWAKKRYTSFNIKKKSGSNRTIHSPINSLKHIQTSINTLLQCIYKPNNAVTGFVSNKSIVDNAKAHTNMNYVFNIDLKDFFPSIELHRIKAVLKLEPFNLPDTKENPIAFMIANLCCIELEVERFNKKGEVELIKRPVLPQGAPTSPILSNIVSQRLDRKLTGVAKRFGLNYTRYADDITFSSMHNVYQKEGDFIKEIYRIIKSQNFRINEKKTRLQKKQYKQEVTGLRVNEKVNVKKRYIKQIRMWLYYWETYGYEKANDIFIRDYQKDKGHNVKKTPKFENVLAGKLEYLKMVKGSDNSLYIRLLTRFRNLTGFYDKLNSILDIWEERGIEEAIKFLDEKNIKL